MHDRASGHRGLPPAIGAFIGEGFGLQQPSTTPAATRADKPFWPTALEEGPPHTRLPWQSGPETRATTSEIVPYIRSRPDTHPCSSHTDEQLALLFLFCTLNLDRPDTRACISPK